MHELPLTLTTTDNHTIAGTVFQPEQPRAALVIAHGMAEHAARYTGFARWLAGHGIAVTTYDHRGHGRHCPPDLLGHFSDSRGWSKVTDDLLRVRQATRARFPGVPLILLGHSMGSFIAQSCAQRHGEALDALILSATNRIHRPQLQASRALIGSIRALYGNRHRSPTIAKMTFGKFNSLFGPNRTASDWLSRDTRQVDRYLADPLCGFECTTGLWHDFIGGMLGLDPTRWRKDLPVHLFAGTRDPVGEMGQGIRRHFRTIREAGIRSVSIRLFEGGRHEMLNETNADEVWTHVLTLCTPGTDRHDGPIGLPPMETL